MCPTMTGPYVLFGSYASYYTAKVRAYLRKKGIPFVEHLPSDPVFRERVRPTSGTHRIPQLLTPEGAVIQDSVEIVDYLEVRFPDIPAFPGTPRQRTFVHLMELLASEGLVQLAWKHRWLYPENMPFVKMDFGRSFKPQGSDEELLKYGNVIADRMQSYGLAEPSPELLESLDRQYTALLSRFEAHLVHHPYFLGGHPSAADYAIMGALHAHMGRDPAPLRLMQDKAPRTFRWVEHMLVPEIQSPEFFDRPVEYLGGDEVPETAVEVLRYIATEFGTPFVLDALAFDGAMDETGATSGHPLSPDEDQPFLPPRRVEYNGETREHRAGVYAEWLSQRARTHFQSLPAEGRRSVEESLGPGVAVDLLNVPVNHTLRRADNRLVLA